MKPEFTEVYSRKERIKHAAITIIISLVFATFFQFWGKSAMDDYFANNICSQHFGMSAFKIWIFVLAFAPSFMILTMLLFLIPKTRRIIQEQQNPPKGYKTYKKTKIRYGSKAMRNHLALVAILVGTALVWALIAYPSYRKVNHYFEPLTEKCFNEPKALKKK